MIFSEAATGGVLWKKAVLNLFSHYSQGSCGPVTLLKTDSSEGDFL